MTNFTRSAVWLTLAVVITAWCALPVSAQLTRGFISGTITDSSGAVLPGVEIDITNAATNNSRRLLSNDVGFYRFVAVEPGVYTIEFKLSGFSSKKPEDIRVGAAQEVVVNQTMMVGPVVGEISVTDTPGVDVAKTDATISRTITERVIQDLPFTAATRDVTRIALLAPTVTKAPGSNEFSANGQRARNNNFMLDGTDNNDLSVTLNNARIVPEAVAEVQVQTSSYSAEFGRNTGAQISMITRSGGNQIHGEGYDYYRGNWMEPIALTNKRVGITSTPFYVANQFGGDVGGPIIKDRTFFFGLVDFNRRREAPTAQNALSANVPTPTGYAALQNVRLGTVALDSLRADETVAARQAALSALSFLPSIYAQGLNYTNVSSSTKIDGVPIEVGTITVPLANPFNFAYNLVRVDHKLTDKDSISYRYQLDKRDQPNVTSNLQFGPRWAANQTIFAQNHALSHTRSFGGHFISETRAAFVRRNLNFPENDPKSATVQITGFFSIGGLSTFPQGRIQNTYQLQNVSTYLAGKHSLKMGFDIRKYELLNIAGFNTKGFWTFNNLQDFMNNNTLSLLQAVNQATVFANQWNHNLFFQDDYKASRDLTLNVGLRYEYNTIPFGLFGTTDPVRRAALIPGPVRPDTNNFAPRVGFAYSPSAPSGLMKRILGDGESAIRGGFGMGYDVLFYNILTVNTNPNVLNAETDNAQNLFPTLAPPVATPSFDPTATFVNSPANSQDPTVHYWSLSLSRQFKTNYVVEAGYTGNRSYHGVRQGQANPPILTPAQAATVIGGGSIPSAAARRLYPNLGSRTTIEMTAKGQYHAGYLKFDRKFSQGLVIGANYTFSGNWSDNDESLGVTDIGNSTPQTPEDFFNYRKEWSRSVFDRPNRFVVHYLYDVPWFHSGWAASQPLSRIMGGWEISGWTEAQSGQPFTVRTGIDSAGIGTTTPARPDLNPGGIFMANYNPTTGLKDFFSGTGLRTFSIPQDATGLVVAPRSSTGVLLANSMPGGGNLGRNTFRGPSYQQWNFSLLKSIKVREQVALQIRADFVNLWNHNNFANPVATMNSPSFGANTATLLSDTRQMLFSAKMKF